ncbi:MAG: hypothetical protein KME08_02605 [Aphanothece sp. CMT-3BRIN-NPC111]|nr:hypothetical protein [Aphanothece sp. CMT-3BRIN-NPC111]
MFLTSSAKPIAPELRESVDKIEQQSPGLSVLAARQFRYSLSQITVKVTISEPRKSNVLEEFILRAGIELEPPPTEDELATVLGLDPVFVESTTANLRALQTLEVVPEGSIKLTTTGREFYEKGSIPQPPKTKDIYAISDQLMGNLIFQASRESTTGIDSLPDLADFVIFDQRITCASALSVEKLQQLVQNSGLGLHAPEEGQIVTGCRVLSAPITLWKTVSILVIFDALENEVKLQARRGKKILEAASSWLNELLAEGKVSLNVLCELTDEEIQHQCEAILKYKNAEVEERIEKLRMYVQETNIQLNAEQESSSEIKSSKVKNPEAGTAVQLRGSEISSALNEILNNARREIILYSPWVSAKVVNKEFIERLKKLANKGVSILIGHGISSTQAAEDRPIPPTVEEKLRAILTPDGLPAVLVFWLGGSHAKEVIVDREVHLCGSNNYLSCRADWHLWDEAVYKVTIPEQVQTAYDFYTKRFKVKAQQLWNEAVQKQDFRLAVEVFCVWGVLGMEAEALNQLQHNNWLELYPVWLNIVHQGLRSKNILPDAACFATALSLLSQILPKEPYVESVRLGWQKVMGAIASQNRDAALKLLSDEVWLQFTCLGIAQPLIESPQEFISKYVDPPKQSDKNFKKLKPNTLKKKSKK